MSDALIVFLIVAVRLLLPLLIPLFPLPTILSLLVLDAADQSILQKNTDLSLDNYQGYDKALDIWYLSVAYLATIRTWTDDRAQHVAAFLWYYRLVGVVAFELLGYRWLLMVFPNTFEYFFIAYEAIRLCWNPGRLSRRQLIGLAAFIWIFIKLPQEWWIHVAQLDFTDFMKEDVFGVPVDTSWGEAIGENLWFVGLLVVVVVAVVLVWRSQRAKVPEPDWSLTVRVAEHIEPVPTDVAAVRDRVLSWRTGEKVALIGLVCVIFASVLPDVDRGPLQTACRGRAADRGQRRRQPRAGGPGCPVALHRHAVPRHARRQRRRALALRGRGPYLPGGPERCRAGLLHRDHQPAGDPV